MSTDKQSVENQRFEIEKFCLVQNLKVDEWIEETTSGTLNPNERQLGCLLEKVKEGDLIICSEISRLGRSLFMIMSILNSLMESKAHVWSIKDGFRLGDDIQSKVLAFAFALSAEIERQLISERTREALRRKKADGITLGRPKGSKSKTHLLDGAEHHIALLRTCKMSENAIAKHLGVSRTVLRQKSVG